MESIGTLCASYQTLEIYRHIENRAKQNTISLEPEHSRYSCPNQPPQVQTFGLATFKYRRELRKAVVRVIAWNF